MAAADIDNLVRLCFTLKRIPYTLNPSCKACEATPDGNMCYQCVINEDPMWSERERLDEAILDISERLYANAYVDDAHVQLIVNLCADDDRSLESLKPFILGIADSMISHLPPA